MPIILKYKWTKAARLAFFFAPIAEINAVIQVPIFCPMMIGSAVPKVTLPVAQSACKIPTDAEEDWITAVRTAPAIIPSTGLENMVRMLVNSGTSANGFTAFDMVSIPNIRTANPSKIPPISCFFSSLVNIRRMIPISAKIGQKDVGFKNCKTILLLSMPDRLTIQDVTVVPILAPMMIPTACDSFIIPEFTNPTTMTVVADDD